MNKGLFTLIENEELVPGFHRLTFAGDAYAVTRPGMFAEVSIPGYFLRRPFSVADADGDRLVLAVRVRGEGTAALPAMEPGAVLDILTGLGNGFDLDCAGERPLLVGGGSGVPALYMACRELAARGARPVAALGFNSASESFYADDFAALGAETAVYTADGSLGAKGVVTDALRDFDYSYVYACGGIPMLKIVDASANTGAQFSLEARMGCGFGACMGCTVETQDGPRRVCKDGPVFRKGELIW